MSHNLQFDALTPAELTQLTDADLLQHSYALENFRLAVRDECKQVATEQNRRAALLKYNAMNESEKKAVAQFIQAQGIVSEEKVNG